MPFDSDFRAPEVIANPYPLLRELRETDPVHWSDSLGGWVLTRYQDVIGRSSPDFSPWI